MSWLRRLYDLRIVNVNVNVVAAGLLAMGITVLVMHKLDHHGVIGWIGQRLPIGREFIINLLTFLVDIVADVAVYYMLHWLANHMPRSTPRRLNPRYADLSFLRDATLVQFERAILSPVLYAIAMGTQHWMLREGYSVGASTTVAFVLGISVSRVLHTVWMLRQEKRAAESQAQVGAQSKGTGTGLGGGGVGAAPGRAPESAAR